MTTNVAGFGSKIELVATFTYPLGITITQFADDADSYDSPSRQIGDAAMGTNGDLITWSKATPITYTINVIPDSEDDQKLDILAQANSPALNKLPVNDIITLTLTLPNGRFTMYTGGVITDATAGRSMASAGRLKTRAYAFKFEKYIQG